jgi:hypothetical protein
LPTGGPETARNFGKEVLTALASGAEAPEPPESLSAQSVPMATESETLAILWQAALGRRPGEALWLVELRGFEPLTSCMPCKRSAN